MELPRFQVPPLQLWPDNAAVADGIDPYWQKRFWDDVVVWPALYLLGVQVLIAVTRSLPPMPLNTVKVVYNVALAFFSLWMCVGALATVAVNFADADWELSLLYADRNWRLRKGLAFWFWWFQFSKYLEVMDTVFLILAKKHASGLREAWYLQVYHHAITPSIGWHAWFLPVDLSFVGVITNTFVHSIMYAYFAVVSAAPALRRYGGYVTSLQLAQFALCLVTGFVPLYGVLYGSGSLYSWVWIQAVYTSMLVFFVYFDRAKRRSAAPSQRVVKENASLHEPSPPPETIRRRPARVE